MKIMKEMKNVERTKGVEKMKTANAMKSFLNVKNCLLIVIVSFSCGVGLADTTPPTTSRQATTPSTIQNTNTQQSSGSSLALSPQQVTKLDKLFKNDKIDSTTKAAMTNVLPLTPEQIEAFKKQNAAVQVAQEPDPISTTQLQGTVRSINLLSHTTPPMLHLVMNYATNISFIGENGQPWPIANIVPGSDAIIASPSYKADPYNSTIIVEQPWVSTNVTYYLKGRVKPIVLFVHTALDTSQGLDASVTVSTDGLSPGSAPLAVKNVGAVSDSLLNAVNNAPGSQWLPVPLENDNLPVGLKMWTSADHQQSIIRVTSGQLVSPDWRSQASNPDNTVTAYSFNYVPLMLLVNSNDGQNFQVRVKQAVETLAGNEPPPTSMKAQNISDIEKAAEERIQHAQ